MTSRRICLILAIALACGGAAALQAMAVATYGVAQPSPNGNEDKPAVKDGLELSVMPAKASFGINEPLVFDIVLKNVSETEFKLPGIAYSYRQPQYAYEVVEPTTQGTWRLSLKEALLELSTISLAPGQSVTHRCTLPNTWVGTTDGLAAFPHPGKFQFIFRITMKNAGSSKARWWRGEMASKPAAFTISAEEPGRKD